MSKTMTASKESAVGTVNALLEISKLDTLFRDLYLARASELLEPLLSRSSYDITKESLASLSFLELQLRSAVERGDWKRSQELTDNLRNIRSSAAASGDLMTLGNNVYERLAEIPIDPFSPGFYVFHGSMEKLLDYRNQANNLLSGLERTDISKRDFYARRLNDLKALSVKVEEKQAKQEVVETSPADLQLQALAALDSGDFAQLEAVVQKLAQEPAVKETNPGSAALKPIEMAELGDDLLYSFSETTLAGATRLGLEPVRTTSRRDFAHLTSHGWQPSFMKTESRQWAKDQISRLTYPPDTTDKRRDSIEFFLLNPFMTSSGTRYRVCLVVEDLLIENFPEPEPKEDMPVTPLLSALGFQSRRGLTRFDIENALLRHGSRIVQQDLGLDPEAFRLIAIPADIYTQLGTERGWGQKEMWTHFDGYRVLEGGTVQALAGGDKRFGGVYDVVSFNTSYTKDSMIARFAVVQRKRMMTWHHK